MNLKTVDIILPNYNKAKYLEECINSILNQSHKAWKLYIIDDNSQDNSLRILKNFEKYENINIHKLRKNMGPSFCRNLGIRISSSEYIAFMDSDDYWKKNKLEEQINFMTQKNYVFTFTDYTPFSQNDVSKKFMKPTKIAETFDLNEFTLNSSINTTTMIICRNILDNLKFKKIRKLEDYLFKCEILKFGHIAHKFNSNSAYYRILNNSRSSQKIKNLFYLWKINKKYLNYGIWKNLLSLIMISINSLKKYGIK